MQIQMDKAQFNNICFEAEFKDFEDNFMIITDRMRFK